MADSPAPRRPTSDFRPPERTRPLIVPAAARRRRRRPLGRWVTSVVALVGLVAVGLVLSVVTAGDDTSPEPTGTASIPTIGPGVTAPGNTPVPTAVAGPAPMQPSPDMAVTTAGGPEETAGTAGTPSAPDPAGTTPTTAAGTGSADTGGTGSSSGGTDPSVADAPAGEPGDGIRGSSGVDGGIDTTS